MDEVLAIDLCAGAGGLSLGLQRAGWDVLGVELDADACETHRLNVGPCERADITIWTPPPAQVVAGGVPCQPFSLAGKRKGLEDERGMLFEHLLRIAAEANAEAFLLENVPGMRVMRTADGTTVAALVERQAVERGWLVASAVLNAAHYGVPQHRRRWFLVGFRSAAARSRWRWPSETHDAKGALPLGGERWLTVRDALGLEGAFATGKTGRFWQGQRLLDVDAPAPTQSTTAPDLLRPSTTERPRRLAPSQLAPLHGFPPGWSFVGTITSQTRQIGNAVPPPLAEAVALSLRAALRAGC